MTDFAYHVILSWVGLVACSGHWLAWRRACQWPTNERHSRPRYYGAFCALSVLVLGGITVLILGLVVEWYLNRQLLHVANQLGVPGFDQIRVVAEAVAVAHQPIVTSSDPIIVALGERYNELSRLRLWLVGTVTVTVTLVTAVWAMRKCVPTFQARNWVEFLLRTGLWACAGIAVLTTAGIALSLLSETLRFFAEIPVGAFLFGLEWTPLEGVFDDKLDPARVGAVPLFVGTALITGIALLVAAPTGLMAAVYLSEFASDRFRNWAKPVLEILAGVPTVVYGFFAALTVAPFLRNFGGVVGLDVASESALAAGIVMGIMIVPFVSSLTDDVIQAVPNELRDGSMALGATRAETITKVVLPAAIPGIASSILLALSRAVGETMIVVMAAGQAAKLSVNPLDAVTTVTVQIVALIAGDTEAATAAGPAFALGFTLFCVTLGLNVIALWTVRRYRRLYG